jgi:HK97 gp10 family phage protein
MARRAMSPEEFRARLANIPEVVKAAARAASLVEVKKIGSAMKAAVPKDSGMLSASIRTGDSFAPRVGSVLMAGNPATQNETGGNNAWHQEFGTQDMPANPFFWPMWRSHRDKARREVNKAIKKAIEQAYGK